MSPIDHFLLTRFNVRTEYGPEEGVSPAWMARRLELFRRFCAPSVAAQSVRDFRWMIFIDDGTAPDHRRAIQIAAPRAELVPLPAWSDEAARIAVDTRRRASRVVTTRLDNDDAIHGDFLRIARQAPPGRFVEFLRGFIYDTRVRSLYQHTLPANPFLSYVSDLPLTIVHQGNHRLTAQKGPVLTLREPAAWLQVIHGDNVSNDVQGTICPTIVQRQAATDFHVELC